MSVNIKSDEAHRLIWELAGHRREPDAATYAAAIEGAVDRRMSAATYVEAAADISVMPVTERQAHLARAAYRDFGKGSGHLARLNFGDCFAYALAKESGEPLLFKGDDFAHTDLLAALA